MSFLRRPTSLRLSAPAWLARQPPIPLPRTSAGMSVVADVRLASRMASVHRDA